MLLLVLLMLRDVWLVGVRLRLRIAGLTEGVFDREEFGGLIAGGEILLEYIHNCVDSMYDSSNHICTWSLDVVGSTVHVAVVLYDSSSAPPSEPLHTSVGYRSVHAVSTMLQVLRHCGR